MPDDEATMRAEWVRVPENAERIVRFENGVWLAVTRNGLIHLTSQRSKNAADA